MKIDIVNFNDPEGAIGLFIDGKLHTYGDDYHNNIRTWCEAFTEGITYMCHPPLVEKPIITHYELNEYGQEKFSNDWNCPEKWPDKKWFKYASVTE